MLHLKKNIWLLFYLIIFIGSSLLASAVYIKHQEILKETKSNQRYLTQIYHNHLDSLFTENETLQHLIAKDYLQNPNFKDEKLKIILKLNPLLLDIWIFSTDGELQKSTLPNVRFTNLLKNKNSQRWFRETLKTEKMVIGKAYFLKSINKWILPIRKRVSDANGKIIAVISTGLDLTMLHKQWSDEDNRQNIIQVTLNNGAFPVLRTNLKASEYAYYNKELTRNLLFHMPLEQLKTQLSPTTEELIQGNDISETEEVIYTLAYNKRYDFWISAEMPYQLVLNKLYHHCFFYSIFYLLLVIIVFSLFHWITKIEKAKSNELTYKAEHDALTGLANRTILKKHFAKLQKKHNTPFALLYVDLDNFKNINDTFGHSYGDLILLEVSKRITQSIFPHKGLVARYSGDEFIIFLEVSNKEEVAKYASFLLESIAQPYLIKHNAFKISSSIGIARFPDDDDRIEALLSYADSSMSIAKKKKNHYLFFSKTVHHQLMRDIEIEQALHYAIMNEEISMVYQPQLDRNQKLFGVEALVRWNSKKLGNIPPDQFIPIAEKNGLMPKLGLYIMHKAMQEISTLQTRENLQFKLSINVSVRQLIQVDFIEKLMDACEKYVNEQLAITIEITESLFIESLDNLLPIFQKMKANAIALSLDDFGTGYSSLSMLKAVPLDELKIDKSFVDYIAKNSGDEAMVKSIINMGKNLGLLVLAEGVEDKAQVDLLKEAGCDIFQGYYFSKPLALNELALFAKAHQKEIPIPTNKEVSQLMGKIAQTVPA